MERVRKLANSVQIVAGNVATGEANGLSPAMLDRLRLDPRRLAGIADAVEAVAALPESHTPSALCVVALAVRSGRLACDAPTRAMLARREFVRAVQPSCQHHLDIAASLDAVLASSPSPSQ